MVMHWVVDELLLNLSQMMYVLHSINTHLLANQKRVFTQTMV